MADGIGSNAAIFSTPKDATMGFPGILHPVGVFISTDVLQGPARHLHERILVFVAVLSRNAWLSLGALPACDSSLSTPLGRTKEDKELADTNNEKKKKIMTLEFKLVDTEADVDLSRLVREGIQSGHLKSDYTHQELNRYLKGKIPADDEAYIEKRTDRETGEVIFVPILLKRKTLMTGEALKTARVEIGRFNEPVVKLSFNSRGPVSLSGSHGKTWGNRSPLFWTALYSPPR
jgi:hypothetical protein